MVAGILAMLQLALVALWATRPGPVSRVTNISIAASCISCASSLMSCALSYAEHGKSLRPSSLLNVFLLVSLLLDAALLRTLWLTAIVNGAIRAVFSASFGVKAVLVVLEAVEKSRFLLGSSGEECRARDNARARVRDDTAPEETSGLYGRAVYAWVAPLLKTGFRRLLAPADLFVLDAEMKTARLGDRFWGVWNNGEMKFFFVVFLAPFYDFSSHLVNCPLTASQVLLPNLRNIASSQAASSPSAGP